MLYPFIYTRTKFHDYRVVTSKSLSGVPNTIVHIATEIARTLIDAHNEQLTDATWTLVRKDGYVLWGMAIVNKELGDQSQDKYNRPARGFFGFISDSQIAKLPYGTTYFRELYMKYVLPIWDSYEQTEQITGNMPIMSGFDFIGKSSRLNNEINVDNGICRIFPSTYDSKSLIEAVFSSVEDCSIATNVHSKRQCVEFGKDRISFTNAVMSSDSKVNKTSDVKVFVPKKVDDIITDSVKENEKVVQKESVCSICGNPVNDNENICEGCKNKQQNKKYIKYGLYGFMALICLLLMFNGSSIWEKILPSKHVQEKVQIEERRDEQNGRIKSQSSFLNTTKSEVNVIDANPDDAFKFGYESSSLITQVNSANNWIRIITPEQQFSKKGTIEFMCDPLSHGQREGTICLTNDEGIKRIISIHQTASTDESNVAGSSHAVRADGTTRNVIIREPDVEAVEPTHNAETTYTFEPTNH